MIINLSNKKILVHNSILCKTNQEKTIGLLKYNKMPNDTGLIFPNCKQIHSRKMKFSFQAIYLDKNLNVTGYNKNFEPGYVSKFRNNCIYVIEVPIGTIEKTNTKINDKIIWKEQ